MELDDNIIDMPGPVQNLKCLNQPIWYETNYFYTSEYDMDLHKPVLKINEGKV